MTESFFDIAIVLAALMGASVFVAVIGLIMLIRSIRRIRVPPNADFFTTMRYVPFALVILLDLLDFGLDMFSAPVMWIFLDRMGLPNLRNKATVEALIPFTGPIPTFTVGWFLARLFNLGIPASRYIEQYAQQRTSHYPPSTRRRVNIIDADDPDW
ncbi:MAG: hypothetical protein GFH27_549349n46 [Chloroflexi bacterium AL-W]|nr:hypothetical protein [Chloroflexi bacterium AL-N1]NOK69944.1 hypothetical protein [Chloroflexi bacterium AL-N10]NOK73759.1 hypothetical protein [Chloroflexi bacterium AL-N5]NOK85476.1 hypothetical protein [Chloroflexi bacterium AL-W]NOK91677.1 hypothetical protein [Chloroflexi bacterium AL-N15]